MEASRADESDTDNSDISMILIEELWSVRLHAALCRKSHVHEPYCRST